MRKFFGLMLCLMLVLSVAPVQSAPAKSLTMGEAINKAGRQRMLTQRMIKAYALDGMKLRIDARFELEDAAKLFDTQLNELSRFASTAEEKAQLEKIALLWSDLQPDVLASPTLAKAGELNELAELLLQESHRFVLMLEKRSGKLAGKLVNISGRQRMLSQRIAKTYLLATWGLDNNFLDQQYTTAVGEFDTALTALQRAPINTKQIDKDLTKVEKNWKIFGISNFSKRYNTRVPTLVVRSMDKILGQMNTITGLYAKI